MIIFLRMLEKNFELYFMQLFSAEATIFLKRGSLVGNEEIHKRGDLPIFEIEY